MTKSDSALIAKYNVLTERIVELMLRQEQKLNHPEVQKTKRQIDKLRPILKSKNLFQYCI